ncbi:MAG: Ldh family oxidoreductase [Candidatus Poribacteria bacterium]|nr:Ldh family oxidoreductase [Candidatus Poribacteria bacterium]
MPDVMRGFIGEAFQKAGASEEDAAHIANLLVLTDLRGVFSHGTRQTPGYVGMMLDGKVNPRPNVQCIDESPTTAVYDGDGGMGHFASYHAAKAAVKKAKEMGLGAATSRNHFHFGSAGKYSRLALEVDCAGFAVSCHRFRHGTGGNIATATAASPMSFAIPAGEQPPIVVDMAIGIDAKLPFEQAFEQSPAAYFKMLGLSHVSHALGGMVAGIWLFDKPADPPTIWEGANQGGFIAAFDISRFRPIDEYKAEIDRHIHDARQMQPAPGYDRSDLPGGLEWEREQEWAEIGIPVSEAHQEQLKNVAERVGIPHPF